VDETGTGRGGRLKRERVGRRGEDVAILGVLGLNEVFDEDAPEGDIHRQVVQVVLLVLG